MQFNYQEINAEHYKFHLKSLSAIQKIKDTNRYNKRTTLTLNYVQLRSYNDLIAPLQMNNKH